MRNAATTRRTSTLTALAILLALAAILSLMGAVPANVPAAVPAQTTTDYDTDDDGYIEVSTLAQLSVIRHDLDGNGDPASGGATAYGTAFPSRDTNAASRMGCPSGACVGYELTANLTFDENGDGQMTQAGDPTYWNSGSGWEPIGTDSARYTGDFKGNRYTIDYLRISRTGNDKGLFGVTSPTARIETVGITNANVTGTNWTGILVGANHGEIVACYTTGSVTVNTGNGVGGLAAHTSAAVSSSYSSAAVSGAQRAGGLIGQKAATGSITHSYSIGAVTRHSGTATSIGGLLGESLSGTGAVTASYFDSTTSGCVSGGSAGCTTSAAGTAQTTTQLQSPTGYTGIYANWNIDLNNIDGDNNAATGEDDPWTFGTASQYPTLQYGNPVDYDTDGDNYIGIESLAQLNAIRHDLDGNGTPASAGTTAYNAAFPDAASGMGCAATCVGYELLNNLNFDENGDGQITSADSTYWNSGSGWAPIGDDSDTSAPYTSQYQADFKGNGYTINNLFISRGNANDIGLFGAITNASRIETLGVTNANVTGNQYVGILSGTIYGAVVACYSTGAATGLGDGVTRNSIANYGTVGGLVGWAGLSSRMATINSSYSTASVDGYVRVGGLAGMASNITITNSYSTGAVTRTGGTASGVGGLVGWVTNANIINSYYDSQTSGRSTFAGNSATAAVSRTTSELQSPTGYTGIYSTWDANIDSNAGNDDPWDFGASAQYPLLKYGGHTLHAQGRGGDYDADNDGYIDVSTLAQLNAIRYDLNTNGVPTSGGAAAYNTAFPNRNAHIAHRMGCPAGACVGYELTASLDFDENGDGAITQAGDPTYWNGGAGWSPITTFAGKFKGNGNTINNLFIYRPSSGITHQALFGDVNASGARIETLGVTNVNIRGYSNTGAVAGRILNGAVVACYSTGNVDGNFNTGGLVGRMNGAQASVHSSYSTAFVEGGQRGGGLVGRIQNNASITNSYSTGHIDVFVSSAGLVGGVTFGASATDSYWDTVTSNKSTSFAGTGSTTHQLQSITDYIGIFANWNVDLNGDGDNDDPWDFGNAMQYPMLKYDGMSTAPQGGQAMGAPDNRNRPVVGERVGVCLTPDDFPDRAFTAGTQYREPWVWEKSTNGDTWEVIPGAGDGNNPPTYEYSPTAADVGSYIRAKVKMTDGSFAITRTLGGRVIASSDAADGGEFAFVSGHVGPRVRSLIIASDPLPEGAVNSRVGWQRCENDTAPFNCTAVLNVPGTWWTRYVPTTADVGKYLRVYAYYETAGGDWTRSVTPFTTGVVSR